MSNIEGLEKKAFKFTIEWVVDVDDVLPEGTYEYLEYLRGVGSAEITAIELVDIE